MKDLILVGGGGHCESVIDVAESAGYHILGILDMPELLGKEVFSYKVIGSDDDIPNLASKAQFVVTVGAIKNPKTRIKLFDRIKSAGGTFATIVASTAYVSKYAQLGEGTVVMHKAFVNAGSKIGANSIINTLANIEHDCVVGNHCHVSTGAMVNGGCTIGDNTFIGSRTVISNSISICNDVVVGAGSFVRKSIVSPGIYVNGPQNLLELK